MGKLERDKVTAALKDKMGKSKSTRAEHIAEGEPDPHGEPKRTKRTLAELEDIAEQYADYKPGATKPTVIDVHQDNKKVGKESDQQLLRRSQLRELIKKNRQAIPVGQRPETNREPVKGLKPMGPRPLPGPPRPGDNLPKPGPPRPNIPPNTTPPTKPTPKVMGGGMNTGTVGTARRSSLKPTGMTQPRESAIRRRLGK